MSGLPPLPPGRKRKSPEYKEAHEIPFLRRRTVRCKRKRYTAMEVDQPERMSTEIKKKEEELRRRSIPELKQELWSLATEIVADDFADNQKLIKITKLVKRLKTNSESDAQPAPQEFLCPISKGIMTDPVLIVTGHTFERTFIQNYLNLGKRNCPVSGEQLYDARLIPNHALRQRISNWCDRQASLLITPPSPSPHSQKVSVCAPQLHNLIAMLPSCSLPEAKSAIKELRYLTNEFANRALIISVKKAIAIALCSVIMSRDLHGSDPDFHIHLLILIENLSQIEETRTVIAKQAPIIFYLTESMRFGPAETRTLAAMTLATLNFNHNSGIHNNRLILKFGVMKAITELLEETDDMDLLRDLSNAIVRLCDHNQKLTKKAVMEGMHRVAVKKMEGDLDFAEELVTVLSLFSKTWNPELWEIRAVQLLVRVVRESFNGVAEDNAVELLHDICDQEFDAGFEQALAAVCSTSYFPFD